MLDSQANPEYIRDGIAHENPITLEEFLENDFNGYEYVKGELVPIAAAAIVHGEDVVDGFACPVAQLFE